MQAANKVTDDIHVLPSSAAIPGFGFIPVNAYVVKAAQPLLVDTGMHVDAPEFIPALEQVMAPEDLRWIWLTHPDQDHVGSLTALLERAPNARLVTNFLGVGILSLFANVPMNRFYLINPGESLDLGDRTITAFRPPSFDNPATMGFYDPKSQALFSSDCFGAALPEVPESANALAGDTLAGGSTLWATVDAPWLHGVDRNRFAASLKAVQDMQPEWIMSSHLPPAHDMTPRLLEILSGVPDAQPFVGPNQVALEAMLAQMSGPPPA